MEKTINSNSDLKWIYILTTDGREYEYSQSDYPEIIYEDSQVLHIVTYSDSERKQEDMRNVFFKEHIIRIQMELKK